MSIYRLHIVYLCKQCLFQRKFQSQFESFSELKATDKTISPKGTLLYNTERVYDIVKMNMMDQEDIWKY